MTTKQLQLNQLTLTMAHNTYSKGLSTYAYYKVSNYEKSEDLVQETFLKAWKYLVKGGEINIMKAFLYHVLNGLIIDDYRKKKFFSLDVLMEKGFELSVDESDQLSNNFDNKNILSLIDLLPDKYKKIIHMRFIEDMSLEEMSQILKQSKNSISVQINRVLIKLRILHKFCNI